MYYILIILFLQTSSLFSQNIDLIQIEGNKKTKDYIILREIKQQINSPLSKKNIIEDKNRIYNLGLFSSVEIDVQTIESQNIYIITVNEMWYIWPFPIIKYDNKNEEFSYGGGIIHNNLRGRDENIALGAAYGSAREYFLWYSNPWISGDHNSLEFGIYNESSDHHVYNIIEKDKGFFTEGGFYKGSNHKFNFWVNYNDKIIETLEESDKMVLQDSELTQADFSYIRLGLEYKYDTRDIYIDPNSGLFFNIELINSIGFNDTQNMHQAELHLSTYKNLFESYWNPIFKRKSVLTRLNLKNSL